MLIRNMFNKYYNEADDGTGAGGAGDDTNTEIKTYTQEEVDALTKDRDTLKEKVNEFRANNVAILKAKEEAEAARIAAESDAKLEAARKSTDFESFEKTIVEKKDKEFNSILAAKDAELEGFRTHVLGESKKAVLGGLSGDFIEPESLDLISQLVKTEFDGTSVKTQFTDFAGNVITTDASEFKKWMGNHPAISHLMKADSATGGGAISSKANSRAVANEVQTPKSARAVAYASMMKK